MIVANDLDPRWILRDLGLNATTERDDKSKIIERVARAGPADPAIQVCVRKAAGRPRSSATWAAENAANVRLGAGITV